MFSQAFATTLRMLLFRAGPQDFPFAAALTPALLVLATVANTLLFSQVLPLSMALGIALAMVGAMALVTRSILRLRNAANRFQQTFNSLLATTAVLTLALLPPFIQVAPQLLQLAKQSASGGAAAAAGVPDEPAQLLELRRHRTHLPPRRQRQPVDRPADRFNRGRHHAVHRCRRRHDFRRRVWSCGGLKARHPLSAFAWGKLL
jgi:hypothetical protein